MKRFLFTIVLAAVFTGCGDNGKDETYNINFDGNSTSSETIAENFTGSHTINIKTNAPAELIQVEKLEQQSWCDLTVGGSSLLRLNVTSANDTGKDRSASFRISAGKSSISYTVTQNAANALTITGLQADDSGNYVSTVPYKDVEEITFKVVTAAASWKLEAKSTSGDWYDIDKKSGVSGDEVTVSIGDNDAGKRTLTLTISADQAIDAVIVITQSEFEGPVMATYFNLFYTINIKGEPIDTQIINNANLQTQYYLAAEYGKDNPKSKFRYETDGAFHIIVGEQAKDGVVNELPEDECNFVVEYDDEYIYIYPKEPNEERKMVYWGVQFRNESGALLTVNAIHGIKM